MGIGQNDFRSCRAKASKDIKGMKAQQGAFSSPRFSTTEIPWNTLGIPTLNDFAFTSQIFGVQAWQMLHPFSVRSVAGQDVEPPVVSCSLMVTNLNLHVMETRQNLPMDYPNAWSFSIFWARDLRLSEAWLLKSKSQLTCRVWREKRMSADVFLYTSSLNNTCKYN